MTCFQPNQSLYCYLTVWYNAIKAQLDAILAAAENISIDGATFTVDLTTVEAALVTIQGQLVTIDNVLDSIKLDTADLATISSNTTTLNGLITTLDAVLDLIKVDTTSIIAALADITTISGQLTTIDTVIDSIDTKLDTLATISTKLDDIGTTTATFAALVEVAAAAVPAAYAVLGTLPLATRYVEFDNQTDGAVYISMDAGTSDTFHVAAGTVKALNLGSNIADIATEVHFRYGRTVPSTGYFFMSSYDS